MGRIMGDLKKPSRILEGLYGLVAIAGTAVMVVGTQVYDNTYIVGAGFLFAGIGLFKWTKQGAFRKRFEEQQRTRREERMSYNS